MMKHKNLAILFLCAVLLVSISCSLTGTRQTPTSQDDVAQVTLPPVYTPNTASPTPELPEGGNSKNPQATASPVPTSTPVPPTHTPTYTPTYTPTLGPGGLAPLDPSDSQSVLDWVQYAVENQDAASLAPLVGENFGYAFYLEGGQSISADDFLSHLDQRLGSQPVCQGVYMDDSSLQIWYSNWSPAWEMTEMCYIDCGPINPPYQSATAGFLFWKSDDEFQLGGMYLNTPWRYYFTANLPIVACSQGVENFATATPAPSCPGAPPQRLLVGGRGQVCTREDNIWLRDAPGREANIIASLPPGTEFAVIGGPECAGNNWSWWQVLTDDGQTGWVAEGGDETDRYYLCPLP